MVEALVQGLWRGAALLFVLVPVLLLVERRARPALLALGAGAMAVGAAMWLVPGIDDAALRSAVLRGNTLYAGLALIAAVAVVALPSTQSRVWRFAYYALLSLVVSAPLWLDGVEIADQARQIAFLKESSAAYAGAAIPLLVSLVLVIPVVRLLERIGAERWVALWSVLLLIVASRSVFEPFVIPSAEAVLARSLHDGVHILIVYAILPDHAYLTGLLWQLIGLTFAKGTAVSINVVVFAGTALLLSFITLLRPVTPRPGLRAAERRRDRAAELAARRRAAAPAVVALLVLTTVAIRAATFQGTPEPPERQPLSVQTAAGTTVGTIDIDELSDGKLHAWTYAEGDREMRVIAINKPDGAPVVTLDACLVCAPDGYAQLGQDLFCLYCGTPIPIDTVGQPGGCNPAPIEFDRKGGKLTFDAAKTLDTWTEVTSGR